MTDSENTKSFVVFGRDVTKIPCFRNSFLYGITGGVVTGLFRFMLTSRPKSAADFAVGSFALITMSYWVQCRYQYSKAKFEMDKMKYLLQQQTLYEGTEREKQLENNNENVLVDA